MLPQVKIKYSKLLDPIFIFYCQHNPDLTKLGWNKWVPPTKEVLDKQIENYKKAWSEIESKILPAMCDILSLEFKRNVIDVYVVSGNPRQISNPLIIRSGFSKHDFISALMHELIHVLCTHNEDILPKLGTWYPNETLSTENHIITHATLKYLYLDVLNDPTLLEANIISSKAHRTPDYAKAWEIVERNGYFNILNEFKSKYKKI